MKPYYTIVLFSVVACLVGCIHFSSNPSVIQQAESIMNTRPDSALKMLQGMADSIHAYPEETQMCWHLLTIQAKDKLYITHTNDSLINHIVEFYDNHDDKEKQMLAYYYHNNWTELRKEINKAYPHFMGNIQEIYPKMSLVETRICLLAKIGMTSTQMAKVLGYSKSGIISSRNRLYKKMFNVEGTTELFGEFIKAV